MIRMLMKDAAFWLYGKIVDRAQRVVLRILAAGPIPQHVAFVMDGNRRYARSHNKKIAQGHSEGFLALKNMLEICLRLNIKCVSAYAFAMENFKRSEDEVDHLQKLAEQKLYELCEHGDLLDQYGVKLRVVGRTELFPESLRIAIQKAERMTSHNDRAIFNLCLSYASREEMTTAVEATIREALDNGTVSDSSDFITEKDIDRHMYISSTNCPPLDILVRTSGVKRLSDFMLWQCNEGTQLQFCKTYWPDFGFSDFIPIILEFQRKIWIESR